MRKKMLPPSSPQPPLPEGNWLELDSLAQAEFSSEAADHPVEAALLPGYGNGWRAEHAGPQTLRLVFDRPQHLRRVVLRFEESAQTRTQEFVLRWRPAGSDSWRDVLRQQFNFSPPATTTELEDFRVDLPEAAALELGIIPDISGGDARASLAALRLG